MTQRPYAEPSALRHAVTDRLRQRAREQQTQLADLQRQFAYDRLLARVFSAEPEAWVLKGAAALLARLGGSARHTLDVDLYRPAGRLEDAEAALRAAASLDLGDFFRFTLEPGRRIADGRVTLRVPVTAYLGVTEFARFHVDLVADIAMTGEPDDVASLVPIQLPGIEPVHYRAYPVADHIADKVCALVEIHPRVGRPAQVSTRYRDLADLVVIARTQSVDGSAQQNALASESSRRGIELPTTFSAPNAAGWRAGYARVVRDVPGLAERDLDAASATVKRFLDPILGGDVAGRWRPDRQRHGFLPGYASPGVKVAAADLDVGESAGRSSSASGPLRSAGSSARSDRDWGSPSPEREETPAPAWGAGVRVVAVSPRECARRGSARRGRIGRPPAGTARRRRMPRSRAQAMPRGSAPAPTPWRSAW